MADTKIRVLFVLQDLSGNGAVRTALNVLRHLDRSKFEIMLYVIAKTGACLSEVPSDIKLVVAHERRRYNKYLIPYYLARLFHEASSYDIIVGAEDVRITYFAYVVAKLLKKPVIGWNRVAIDHWLKELHYWHTPIVRLIYPRLTRIVCVSQAMVSGLPITALMRRRNIEVIYDSYDIDRIIERAEEEIPQWYAKLLCKPTLMGLGRLCNQKGFDILIKAHARVLQRGIEHNLVIVGSGPLESKLTDLATSLGVADSVFIPGYIQNPYPLLKKATAFVLSSRYEGLPGAVVEALAVGTPVVSTSCTGSIETLSNGKYGILADPDDVCSLANGMTKILSDHTLREMYCEAGIGRSQWFRSEKRAAEWEKLLCQICTPPPRMYDNRNAKTSKET